MCENEAALTDDDAPARLGNVTETSAVVSGLVPGVLYAFRVRAYTSVGNGPYCRDFLEKTLDTGE